MASEPSEEQGKSNHAEPPADVRLSFTSDPSQSNGAPAGISEKEKAEDHYQPLLRAAIRGDWESAELFFKRDSASMMAKITRLESSTSRRAMDMCISPNLIIITDEGKTFWEIFMENHKELLDHGEKWVKETANSCMIVSTLIATVLFTAAFTVPGGNDNNTRIPLLLGKDSLLVFTISDTLGLFSSVTVIMLFLAILSSQYEWEDFLRSLLKKIIMGLSFLFLSLVFMLVAFAATLTIVLDKRLQWVFIPITLLASLTVFSFLRLQLPLLFRMVKSTYGSSIFRPVGIRK